LKIVWLPSAIADRDAQLDFIAQEAPLAAIEQGDLIEYAISLLAQHPKNGRTGRGRGARELVVARTPFIAVYRVNMVLERVEVLRLLHGSRQWP
jgi:toxin ParE1/3/4